jgi:putative oxidoreductase
MENGKGKTIALWVLRVLVGLAFLGAGWSKLAGTSEMVAVFTKIGFGQGFRVITGLLEVAGAIGLFVPRLTTYAALLLAAVMIGAVGFHLTTLGGNPTPPIVLLLLSALIAFLSNSSTTKKSQQE